MAEVPNKLYKSECSSRTDLTSNVGGLIAMVDIVVVVDLELLIWNCWSGIV